MTIVPFKDFEAVFNSLVKEAKPFIAWFTAQKNEDGSSWCPDCVAAAPFLGEITSTAQKRGWKTYVFQTGPKEGYKNPEFIMRTHKLIKLKCIPTVAYFDGKSFTKRLQEAQITNEKQRNLLLEDEDDD